MEKREYGTGMYTIDGDYRIVNFNQVTKRLYPNVEVGCICYKTIALQDKPCGICPLRMDNALFYNPLRKEWIYANAASVENRENGNQYCIQFQLRQRVEGQGIQVLRLENVDEHIMELSNGDKNACAIGSLIEPGAPLFFANESMLRLMGYDDMDEMVHHIGGLVFNTIHPEDVMKVTEDLTKCALEGGGFESTYRLHQKGGSWLWIVAKGKRIVTASNQMALLCVCTELSEFVHRQKVMFEENVQMQKIALQSQAILRNMPNGYHRCAPQEGFPFLYVGRSFEQMLGYTWQEIKEQFDDKFINLVWPEDIPICMRIIDEIGKKGQSNSIYRIKCKSGGYRWVSDATMYVEMGEDSFYQGTLADVTEFIESMQEQQTKLEAAMKQLEAVSQAKSAFLFNVSHDVRTPMNAIQGYTHIIQQQPDNAAMVTDMIGKIKKSSDTLMQLLNDVLELSRIESGKDEVDQVPVNLNALLEHLHIMFQQEMDTAGIAYVLDNQVQDPNVRCDELKCTRILMNMLSNARKFTASGGTVTLGIQQLESRHEGYASYRFFVRDTGIGMSEEFQTRAFEEFERERSSTDSGVSGSGLGLAIIKHLVELMGGSCSIESELGKGTEISVTLELQQDQPAQQPETAAAGNADFSGKRVLLVEDNAFNREIGRYILEGMGLTVEEACDGSQAVSKILQEASGWFDLVLMDVQMPVMDGYMAAQEIRRMKDPGRSAVPIIAMTANAFAEDREKCLQVGMNAHLGKPIDPKRLAVTLMQYL